MGNASLLGSENPKNILAHCRELTEGPLSGMGSVLNCGPSSKCPLCLFCELEKDDPLSTEVEQGAPADLHRL